MAMSEPFVREQYTRLLRFLINKRIDELDDSRLKRSAVIFSPHPDDETLGCGGTIIRKKKNGAELTIVCVTDGRRSHRHLISESELKLLRAREALAATRLLGLKEKDVIFLEFENGKLNANRRLAVSKVLEIIVDQKPEEIFIPYSKEPLSWSEDHSATNRIVVDALRSCDEKPVIYEYPIWFWYYWPWILRASKLSLRQILNASEKSVLSSLSLLKDFRCGVYVRDVLKIKREALDQYKSQMTRLVPDPRWQTLDDLSSGDFLECFFQEREIFRQYRLTG
jgi:LmbE family N-acetylglucosaminyl deacetylase